MGLNINVSYCWKLQWSTLGNRQGRRLLVALDWHDAHRLPMTALGFYKNMDDLGCHALSGYRVPSAVLRCREMPSQDAGWLHTLEISQPNELLFFINYPVPDVLTVENRR